MQLFLRLALGPEVASGGPKNSSLNPGKLENTGFFNTAVALGTAKECCCRPLEEGRGVRATVEPEWPLK